MMRGGGKCDVAGESKPDDRISFSSFHLLTMSSHATSVLNRCMIGNLGFLEERRNPLCLKLTTSPGDGTCFLLNSDVATGATNCIPFGLLKKQKKKKEIFREVIYLCIHTVHKSMNYVVRCQVPLFLPLRP